ncbi:DUF308 domain-containing protein [Mycolicibacterium moriokaense]|nr:DUF308 domain-containing protein [Mycolicibacterium moriokaense]
MLIVALVLAVIGLAALVTAVVTSNELIAWVCIAAAVIGVVLLIIDALRERSRGGTDADAPAQDADGEEFDADYPEEPAEESGADSDSETAEDATESADEQAVEEDHKTS